MGTYFPPDASQADIVDRLLNPLKKNGHLVTSKICRERNGKLVLWTVENGERNGHPYQFIGCYLLVEGSAGWGYKPMDETVGPFRYSVPQEWLDKYPCIMTPDNQDMLERSASWRAGVRLRVNTARTWPAR